MQTGTEGVDPSPRPERLGPYRVEALLGRGGMGEVYRAYDERLDRRVALKQISGRTLRHPQSRRRFRREARAAARLNHSAIVQIYDIVETPDSDWIVMELVAGRTLAERLREGPIPVDQAMAVLRDLAGGLEAAHHQGVVHRDLKTENVMMTDDGQVKILDFGLAKQLVAADPASSLSLEGTLLGTARAMAPEQALGKPVDHRSDLFSLGTLSYEMVTGKSPFLAPTAVETAIRVCSHRQTPARQHNPAIPSALSELVDRLLEKEPSRRPPSAVAVLRALERIEDGRENESSVSVEALAAPPSRLPTLSLFDVDRGELSVGEVERVSSTPDVERASHSIRLRYERRELAVLCCDLVGDGEVGGPLDPEVFHDVGRRFRRLAEAVVGPWGGYLVPSTNHWLVIYFGYPERREGAAVRAVEAARALLAEVEAQHRRSSVLDQSLAMRAAIHAGPAVVRSEPTAEPEVVLAQTLELVNGLLRQTPPGTVVVSGRCRELLGGRFEVEPLTSVRLRGFEEEIPIFRPLEARDPEVERRRRFEGVCEGLDPAIFVGREAELALLRDRWNRAVAGTGQVVALCADAGAGGTRLLIEMAKALQGGASEDSPPRCLVTGAHLEERRRPGRVVRRALRRLRAEALGNNPAIERFLQAAGERVPGDDVLDELLAESRRSPFVLVIEDLHSVDAESLKWIGRLVGRAVEGALLLVVSYRPGMAVPWGEPRHLMRLGLPSLTLAEAVELAKTLLRDGDSVGGTPEEAKALALRAGLLPRDLVDLARARRKKPVVREVARVHRQGEELPPAVADRWNARLERLGSARELVRLASAFERPFPVELLEQIAPLDSAATRRELGALVAAGEWILRDGELGTVAEFRHPLLREVAYSTLIRRERQRLHRRLAPLLEGYGVSALELAGHLAKGGEASAAADAYGQAALDARREGDRPTAIAALEEGLALLRRTPESDDRDRRELSKLTALGPLLSGVRGFDDPALEELYGRAAELCLRQEDDVDQFAVLRSISAFFVTRARPRKNLPTVEKLLRIATLSDQVDLRLEAHYAAGLTYFAHGELESARRHLEAGAELAGEAPESASIGETGEAPVVACRAVGAVVLWLLGDEARAVERSAEAIAEARTLGHPNTLAAALCLGGWLHQLRRDPEQVRETAGEALAIAREQGFLVWATQSELLLGWAAESRDAEAASRLALSLEVYRDNGVLFAQTYLLSLLAEIGAEQREVDLALRYLLEALTAVEVTGEAFWQAELLRLCGNLVLISDGVGREPEERLGEAESYFERAIEMSRRQGAASLEYRAALDLAQLWRDRGLDDDADELLASVGSHLAPGETSLPS